jgi:hypothetical protein
MRRTWIVLCFVLALLTGCANWKQAAYKGTGTVVITADAAMKAWASYVAAGQAKAEQEVKVKAAYEKYQRAALTLIAAGKSATANGNRAPFDIAVAASSAAQSDLVALVQSFLPSKLQPRPTPPIPAQ